MADDWRLSKENKQKIVDWVAQKAAKRPLICSVCHTQSWQLGEHLVAPTLYKHGGGLVVGGVNYPQALLICKNCGHTIYLNAVIIGVASDEKEVSEKEKGLLEKGEPASGGKDASGQ